MTLRIGVSGKRYISANENKQITDAVDRAIKSLLLKHKTSHFIGYTSLAIGADTIFADVVQRVYKQSLNVVLPFEKEEYLKDFESNDAAVLNKELEGAKIIETISDKIPVTPADRSEAYFAAGKYIVDNCDEVIFIWDELKPEGRGGTAEIMGYYCEKKNKSNFEYIKVLPAKNNQLNEAISKGYVHANENAIRFRDEYKRVWKTALASGWIAVLIFAINTAFNIENKSELLHWLFVSLEFLLLIGVYILTTRAQKRNFHGRYLKERIRAERYRLLGFFYQADIPLKISLVTYKEDEQLSKIAEEVNNSIDGKKYRSTWYANYRLRWLIEDQQKYHTKKVKNIGKKQELFETINTIVAVSLFFNLFLYFLSTTLDYWGNKHFVFYPHEITIFINIFFPATYAAIEGILYFEDWELLKRYSASAKKSLTECISALPIEFDNNECYNKQIEAINLISSIMLTDNRNWTIILEDKSNYRLIM